MAALTSPRGTTERHGHLLALPVAAGVTIYAGALACANAAGLAVKGTASAALTALGRAEHTIDNSTGGDGDAVIQIRPGLFRWDNAAGGDALTAADIGAAAWIVDDATVGRTALASRSPAGRVVEVTEDGVWVAIGPTVPPPRSTILTVAVPTLNGTAVHRVVAPVAGYLTAIRSVTAAALATGDATLTAAINGTPVTGGVLTVTQAGSAVGDVDAASPTAAHAVAAGDVIALTVGGTNSAAVAAAVTLTIIARG